MFFFICKYVYVYINIYMYVHIPTYKHLLSQNVKTYLVFIHVIIKTIKTFKNVFFFNLNL